MASYSVAIAVFLAAYLARSIFPDIALLRGLAAISYPLYVVHGIMGYVAMRIMLDYAIMPGLCLIIAFLLAAVVSWFLHVFVEVPTQLIGKRRRGSKTSIEGLLLPMLKLLPIFPGSSPTKLRRGQ